MPKLNVKSKSSVKSKEKVKKLKEKNTKSK